MLMISLEAFFRTGTLGPVRLGMSREQVQQAFGPPPVTGLVSRASRQPAIWKYGDLELHFVQGGNHLFLIHLDHFQIPQAEGELLLDPWMIRGGMPRASLEAHLAASALPFQHIPSPEPSSTWLCVGAGVVLAFLDEEHPFSSPTGLNSISLLDRSLAARKPHRK